MNEEKEELKPCKFCGEKPTYECSHYGKKFYRHICKNAKFYGTAFQWNIDQSFADEVKENAKMTTKHHHEVKLINGCIVPLEFFLKLEEQVALAGGSTRVITDALNNMDVVNFISSIYVNNITIPTKESFEEDKK